jgi:prepilin-type N-terminal cleavage/methylation domain-containing protein
MGWMRRRRASTVEDGFTLIEVIVALMLMSIVLMAGAGFMIRTVTASTAMGGRQDAVAVANQVLEQIRAVNPTFDSTGVSPLVYGRGQTEVAAQWAAAATAGLDVSGTYTGGGSTAFDADTYQTSSSTPTVPLQQTISLGGKSYVANALIGTCVRATSGSQCGKLTTGDELFRAVVRVAWDPGAGRSCAGQPCAYVVSTLIDPTQDPVFNASRKPVANPDNATTPAGTPVSVGVTANDSGDFALSGAVTIITTPVNGTLSVSNNIVMYTPTTGFSGTNTFTYTVTDLSSRTSTATTVTVTVTPIGTADTGITTTGTAGALSVAVLTNDVGTGLSLVSVAAPTVGSATISGSNVLYTAPTNASGTVAVTYTAKDGAAQSYTGTLTVTVKPAAATAVTTGTCWAGWAKTTALQTISLNLPASAFIGTGPFTVGSPALVSGPTGASVTVSSNTLTYKLPANTNVPQAITYTVTDANGIVSNSITMTLKGTCP